eukprot:CAMPEP_0194486964 /NCGR_PEP_ID=MMETSP0253-20130528/7420_1 /TAXON_ID=2966 /ORGANISM="Noctiluca scintillans" /LENGTH=927 /DNA_ID=CAMNT_0039327117 /DNA_START=21 /DNA_END=2804 /DNA_ORIENTATION=+
MKYQEDLPAEKDLARRPSLSSDTPMRHKVTVELSKRDLRKRGTSVWKRTALRIVDSTCMVVLTTLLTIYALIGDDLRKRFTNKPADDYFNAGTLVCIVIFSLDIFLSVIGKDDYFMGFFFWLDLISTASLVLDLTFVFDWISESSEDDVNELSGAQTARIGARLVRIVRVIRLIRIFKLFKTIQYSLNQRKQHRRASPGDDDDWLDVDLEDRRNDKESRVGKKLSELTTRKVILLVLTMMLGLPFLLLDEVLQLPLSSNYGVDIVNRKFTEYLANITDTDLKNEYQQSVIRYVYFHNWFNRECPDSFTYCRANFASHCFWIGIVAQHQEDLLALVAAAQIDEEQLVAFENDYVDTDRTYQYSLMPEEARVIMYSRWSEDCPIQSGTYRDHSRFGMSLLRNEIAGHVEYAVPCPEDLRSNEYAKATPLMVTNEQLRDWHIAFYFDNRDFTQLGAEFSLITVAFVCVILCIFSVMFSQDAHKLVLHPVEAMISRVDQIRENPLMAMKMADEEFKREEAKKAKTKRKQRELRTVLKDFITCKNQNQQTEVLETVILEKTIIKLGSLLALGFGEAGANIIEQNMHGSDSAAVDAMVLGKRVECIVGNARIRDFSSATEVLQAKVMTFVNQIAEIVHGVVDEFHGAANKNNGDTFLLVWRTADFDLAKVSKIADMSMLAFARILGAVHRSAVLKVYREHPGLQQRLGSHCRVNLSFGLHCGWAIEGAVGSEFKIDASYLSPNVSIAETVERATQIYKVAILVAESVINACSPQMAAHCRLIDKVVITGQSTPMQLYVIDLDYLILPIEPSHGKALVWNSRQRFRARQFLEAEKAQKWGDDVQVVSLFNRNQDVAAMRVRYTIEFVNIFNMGYQNYSEGEWQVSHRLLSKTKTMLGTEDGPSTALLKYMEYPHGYEAPPDWKGVRELGQANPS